MSRAAFAFNRGNLYRGQNLIKEALAGSRGTVGFRTRATLDDAPETHEKTRLAVARAKEGDQEALRYLYVTYSQNIYGYVRSIVRDDHEAEDVTQHVFAKLMTTLVKYDDRGVPFFAWLIRMARNVAIDHLRANRLTPTETVLDPASTSPMDLDRGETVRAALGGAARRAARSRRAAPRRRADARGDRRPDGSDRELDPRSSPPRPAGAPARADAARLDAVDAGAGAPADRRLTARAYGRSSLSSSKESTSGGRYK